MSLARLRKMQKAAKERKQDAEQDRLWIEATHWLWTVLVNDGPNAQHAQHISMTIKYLNNDSVKTEAEKKSHEAMWHSAKWEDALQWLHGVIVKGGTDAEPAQNLLATIRSLTQPGSGYEYVLRDCSCE